MIQVKSLSKFYGKKQVLNAINLSFESGKIYGVVGENGAGKTTLFKCLASMESFKGDVIYNNGVLKNKTGFLETNPFFMSKITGLEYLKFVCNARGISLENIRDKNIFELPLDKYAETYSTGMKKKLALTGVLMLKNNFFLLDEPFNGVDITSNIIINEILKKLRDLKKTIVLSSHLFSTLQEICDYIYYIKEGKLIKKVERKDFSSLEKEMLHSGIHTKISNFDFK